MDRAPASSALLPPQRLPASCRSARHPGHEEIEGIIGEAPEAITVVSDSAAAAVEVPDRTRVSYLTQTTLAVDETADIVKTLRERLPLLRELSSGDICYATTNRQRAPPRATIRCTWGSPRPTRSPPPSTASRTRSGSPSWAASSTDPAKPARPTSASPPAAD